MHVHIDPSALRETKWYEYAVRFIFGGLITVGAGVIAKEFGPAIGGIFLAFPAIFPASATLIEKHEMQKAQRAGLPGKNTARQAVATDAMGAALGSIGLVAFAVFVWQLIPQQRPWMVLAGATLIWLIVSLLLWSLHAACRSSTKQR